MKFKTQLFLCFGVIYGLYAVLHFYLWIKMDSFENLIKNQADSYTLLNLSNTVQNELQVYLKESIELSTNVPEQTKLQLMESQNKSIKNVNTAISSLEGLKSSKQSQEVIIELKKSIYNYSEITNEMNKLLKQGNFQEATKYYWNHAHASIDRILKSADSLVLINNKQLDKYIRNADKNYKLISKLSTDYLLIDYAIGAAMLIWLLLNITRRLNQVSSVMEQVDYERLDQLPRIKITAKDEIGKIAISYNEMAHSLEKHTKQEKELKILAEEQSWLKTKVADIANIYPGVDNVDTLAHLFITKVTPMLDANYGVFYIKKGKGQNTLFKKNASYAFNNQNIGSDNFKLGEGIVGQSALENRIISMKQVPENYIKIVSGTGMATPNEVIIIPSEFEGEVLAVIELAKFGSFSTLEQLTLKEIINNLGINIKSILRHTQVENLLQESQALTEELQSQSEELQSQQEELRTVNEQLETQYENSEQKTKELENVKSSLEEKAQQLTLSLQYKSEFLANMSHELRTPLNSLLILAQILAENSDGNLTPKQVNYVETIYSSGNDLLFLINDILDIAKIEAGKLEISMKEVRLMELKNFIVAQFSPVARKKNIQFNVSIDPNLPSYIYTDQHRLEQILKNLLSNAFKFTEKGNVSLIISKSRKNKSFYQIDSNIEFEFSVIDTGIGIPSEYHDIIFEAFKQADGTINRKYGGTGLGLSISREFSHLLGGFIEVESIENKGSTFTLYLPNIETRKNSIFTNIETEVAATLIGTDNSIPFSPVILPLQVEENPKQSYEKKALLEGKKILVVDDDMRNIFAITTALESYKVDVKFAENGKEGVTILQNHPDIDLILMDIMMPEMDGFEAIRIVRKIEKIKKIPIIALTAKAMKSDRDKCIEAGASDYISKPVNLDQLISIMKVWLYK